MTPAQARDRFERAMNYRIPVGVLVMAGLAAFGSWQQSRGLRELSAEMLREANRITADAVPKL